MSKDKLCESKWKQRTHDTHQKHLEYFNTDKGKQTKVLLLGSSMMERFFTTGKRFNNEYFIPRNVSIAGVGGDGIQHMLYRVDHGLIEACPDSLELIILQAGTNNTENSNVEQIVTGTQYLIDEIKKRRENVKIILFSLTPRDSQRKKLSNEKIMERIKQINIQLADLENIDGYINIFDDFIKSNGTKDASKYDDHVHFNSKGYGIFAKSIVNAIDSNL